MKPVTRGKAPREASSSFLDGGVASIAAGAAALLACSSPSPPHTYVAPREMRPDANEALHAMLVRVRRGGARNVRFVVPTGEVLAAVRRWTTEATTTSSVEHVPSGFALWRSETHPDLYALVEEGAPRGSGVYVFRTTVTFPWIIEVPHSFSDLRTLPIGMTLFEELDASALLVNTVHRYRGGGCIEPAARKTCASDVAHAARTVFQEVHRGLLDGTPTAWVIAVHGFTPRDGEPDVIVSAAGTSAPAECIASALSEALLGYAVALFPRDTQRLGGVTGVQARDVRERGALMIHLELGRRLREALAQDASLRSTLATALRRCAHTVQDAPP